MKQELEGLHDLQAITKHIETNAQDCDPEVASVDRKSEASHVEATPNVECRGLSITRLEGGRWRLRRTGAMEKVRECGLMLG